MPHCNVGSYVLLGIGAALLIYTMVQVARIMGIEPEFVFTEDGEKKVVTNAIYFEDQAIVFALQPGNCDDLFNDLTVTWACKFTSTDSTENRTFLGKGTCYNGVNDSTFASSVKLTKDCKTVFKDNYTIIANFTSYDYTSSQCGAEKCPQGPGEFTAVSKEDIWVHWKLDTTWGDFAEALFGVVQIIAAVLVSIIPVCCAMCACCASCIVFLVSSPPPDPAAMQQAQVQMGQMGQPAYGMQQPAYGMQQPMQ